MTRMQEYESSRGLGHASCDHGGSSSPSISGTRLALVTAGLSAVWSDRASEIRKLREQGETLANVGQRFGLSAEHVRQILDHESQEVLIPG